MSENNLLEENLPKEYLNLKEFYGFLKHKNGIILKEIIEDILNFSEEEKKKNKLKIIARKIKKFYEIYSKQFENFKNLEGSF